MSDVTQILSQIESGDPAQRAATVSWTVTLWRCLLNGRQLVQILSDPSFGVVSGATDSCILQGKFRIACSISNTAAVIKRRTTRHGGQL